MELLAICFAVAGILLLATHGQLDSLAISKNALIFGLLSALSVVVYNLQSERLIKTYGTLLALGWGMLIGGILLSLIYHPWHVIGSWDMPALFALVAMIVLGTVVSFSFYLEGVNRIGATAGSLLSSAEPLSATFLSVWWLKASLDWADAFGIALILSTVILLTLKPKTAPDVAEMAQSEANL